MNDSDDVVFLSVACLFECHIVCGYGGVDRMLPLRLASFCTILCVEKLAMALAAASWTPPSVASHLAGGSPAWPALARTPGPDQCGLASPGPTTSDPPVRRRGHFTTDSSSSPYGTCAIYIPPSQRIYVT